MVGDTITASGNTTLGPSTATIDSSVEFASHYGYLNWDFDEGTLLLTSLYGISWNVFSLFTFSDFEDTITGFELISNNGFSETSDFLNGLSYTEHSISLNMHSGSSASNSSALCSIQTSAVPEPSTMLLLASGLAGLGLIRRKLKV